MVAKIIRFSGTRSKYLLILPLVFFVAVFFVLPIASMLHRAVYSPEVMEGLPETTEALKQWQEAADLAPVQTALIKDLRNRSLRTQRAEAARRLNYEIPGFRRLIMSSARAVRSLEREGETFASEDAPRILAEINPRWTERRYWQVLSNASQPYTNYFLTAAIDLERDQNGDFVAVSADRRIFVNVMLRTLLVSAGITGVCLLLGYPFANFLANASGKMKAIGLLAVLLPFWTSLLVRTSAWIVVLQREGIINWGLSPLIDQPLELIFNRIGVFVVMVHVLMPFMVLPIYSTMKGIPNSYTKAAASLGASPLQRFLTVYLPLTMPGVLSGSLITFIVCIGYYITPALVGGPNDQMIGYFIAFYTNTELNWGLASALSLYLFALVIVLFVLMARTAGLKSMMEGAR